MHVARLLPLACLLGGAAGFVAPASRSAGRCPRALTVPSSTVSYVDAELDEPKVPKSRVSYVDAEHDEPTVLPDPWWFRALEIRLSAADQLQKSVGLRATQRWWLMRTERRTRKFAADFLRTALALPSTDEVTLDGRVGQAREWLELAMVDEAKGWLKRANPVLHLPKEEPTFNWALGTRSDY